MSSSVNVDVQANIGQAQKELRNFGKQIAGIAKVWENVMGGKGSRQASTNLQQLSKGVDQLGKAAEKANIRLQSINTTLGQVTAKRKSLEGTTGSVLLKDRDIYKSLADQEKSLARQQRTWSTIAAIRGRMAANNPQGGGAAGGPGGNNPGGAGGGGGLGGRLEPAFAGLAGGGAAAITELVGGAISAVVAAAGAVAVKGFGDAVKQDETLTRFLPRMRPGKMGSTGVTGLARRMRGVGRPLAYNAEESLSIFQTMSEGGGNFGHGLERDTKSSMQFARMFGLDAGGVASMNATAQRMGAFKAGDAKKFAGMLATEIARTGLGPRAQEVQEATIMLLNQQMQTNPRANAAPLMALQTILNKTGVPAFQGAAGASFIGQLQQGITNPNSEGTEALLMQAAQKAGVHSLFGFEMFKGQGLNNAKTLPAILQTILEGSHGNGQIAQMSLQQGFNLPLPKVHALFQATHGFRDLSSGAIKSAMAGLQGGVGSLEKGAASATGAFSSLDIKSAQIVIHEATLRTGEGILPTAGAAARKIAGAGGLMAGIADSKLPFSQKANKWAGVASHALGLQPGGTEDKALHFGAGLVGAIGEEVAKSKEFEQTHPGQKRRLGQILNGVINTQMQRGFGGMFNSLNAAGDAADGGFGAKWHGGAGGPTALVKGARQLLGTPYAWGGVDPATGLDCSGSMQQIFRRFGVNLPRLAHNQAQLGRRVGKGDLQPGDLMFFNTGQGADHHVGMYTGGGHMIHASSGAGRMVEVPFTGWLANHFSHGQRITVEVTVNHPAFKAHIREAVHEHHQDTTRSKVNTRNKRR